MCGICCTVSLLAHRELPTSQETGNLRRRGPDCSQQLISCDLSHNYSCLFSGHVLHLRGQLTPQPLQDQNGNIFLWNGEVFGGIEISDTANDTQVMFEHVLSCGDPNAMLSLFSKVQGPWAFIYYHKRTHSLWFGRDFFGRRSLLWRFSDNLTTALCLASVTESCTGDDVYQWQEVPTSGIFKCNLSSCAVLNSITLSLYPWWSGSDIPLAKAVIPNEEQTFTLNDLPKYLIEIKREEGKLISPVSPLNIEIPESFLDSHCAKPCNNVSVEKLKMLISEKHRKNAQSLVNVLSEAVRKRVLYLPQSNGYFVPLSERHADVAILFSGGLDSMVLAALADRHVPPHKPIDLLNVAFRMHPPNLQKLSSKKLIKLKKQGSALADKSDMSKYVDPFDVPDRITGRSGLEELKVLSPTRIWNFVEINITPEELQLMRQQLIAQLVQPLETVLDDSIGCAVWFAAKGNGMLSERGETKPYISNAKVKKKTLY